MEFAETGRERRGGKFPVSVRNRGKEGMVLLVVVNIDCTFVALCDMIKKVIK